MTTDAAKDVDISQYTKNLNSRIDELIREAQDHPNEFVARSLDGRSEIAYAKTELELIQCLEAMNHDPSLVVIEEVTPIDETARMR